MFSWLKYLPLLLKMRDISNVYEEEKGQNKPWYLSRRFFGVVIIAIFAFLSIQFGFDMSALSPDVIANHIVNAVQALIGLYGIVMVIVGYFKRKK